MCTILKKLLYFNIKSSEVTIIFFLRYDTLDKQLIKMQIITILMYRCVWIVPNMLYSHFQLSGILQSALEINLERPFRNIYIS